MAITIKVKGEKLPEPVEMPPPGERRGTVLRERGQPLPDMRVYIREDVLKAMHKRARDAGDYEVGGFYLGGLHHYEKRRYIDITVQIPALKAESARAQLAFTNEAQKALHEAIEKQRDGEIVLGWYHTHPGYGVFLSGYDLFVQRSYYTQSHHTAIVIDPHASGPVRDVGVFVWENDQISRPYGLVVYGLEK